jgi:hypothetical protein
MLARADVVGVRVDLTATGADALARMLLTAAADGVAQLDQDEDLIKYAIAVSTFWPPRLRRPRTAICASRARCRSRSLSTSLRPPVIRRTLPRRWPPGHRSRWTAPREDGQTGKPGAPKAGPG